MNNVASLIPQSSGYFNLAQEYFSYIKGSGKAIPGVKQARYTESVCVHLDGDETQGGEDIESSLAGKQLDEKTLHYLWAEQYLIPGSCRTADGQTLKIISPGFWNQGKGPDFKQAKIEIAGKVLKGDIEIHIYSSDWSRHQHLKAPDYNRVILHVVLWNDARISFVETERHKKICQLVLTPYLEGHLESLEDILEFPLFYKGPIRFGGPGRCYSLAIPEQNRSVLQQFISMAGEARLLNKIVRYSERLQELKQAFKIKNESVLYDELLYQGIMEALGYKNNRQSFLLLARAIPYKVLKETIQKLIQDESVDSVIKGNSVLLIQAILFHYSGLISQVIGYNYDTETRNYLASLQTIRAYLLRQGQINPAPEPIKWDLSGTRPVNYPQRRIAGLSYFLSRAILNKGLLYEFNQWAEYFEEPGMVKKMSTELFSSFNSDKQVDYWNKRCKIGGKLLAHASVLIGRDRLMAMIVNIVFPVLILRNIKSGPKHSPDRLIALYKSIPSLSDNYVTRFMSQRLFGNRTRLVGAFISHAFLQQGLFQIFNDFCAQGHDGCENCGLLRYLKLA
jgi:hypothetical protein